MTSEVILEITSPFLFFEKKLIGRTIRLSNICFLIILITPFLMIVEKKRAK